MANPLPSTANRHREEIEFAIQQALQFHGYMTRYFRGHEKETTQLDHLLLALIEAKKRLEAVEWPLTRREAFDKPPALSADAQWFRDVE